MISHLGNIHQEEIAFKFSQKKNSTTNEGLDIQQTKLSSQSDIL